MEPEDDRTAAPSCGGGGVRTRGGAARNERGAPGERVDAEPTGAAGGEPGRPETPDASLPLTSSIGGEIRDGFLYLWVRCPVCEQAEPVVPVAVRVSVSISNFLGSVMKIETADFPLTPHDCPVLENLAAAAAIVKGS